MADDTDAPKNPLPRRLKPVYRADGTTGHIVIYEGNLLLSTAKKKHPAYGRLELRLLPKPMLAARFVGEDGLLGFQLQSHETAIAIAPGATLDPPTQSPVTHASDSGGIGDSSIWLNRIEAGRVEDAERYFLHVSGSLRAMLPTVEVHDGMQPQLAFSIPGWNLTLAPVLRADGDTDFNFVIDAVPLSPPVGVNELERLRWRVFILLSLLAGREVGVGPTCGIDASSRVVWLDAGAPRLRAGKPGVLWCPSHLVATALPTLATGFAAISADQAMQEILDRAIGHLLAACGDEVLDIRIPMATTGLELLSWATLQQQAWLRYDTLNRLAAGARVRLLLQWAGIPITIPDIFHALRARRSRVGQPDWAGPEVLFNVRNALVHPPKRLDEPAWPDSDELIECWQLATWYLELVVLRVLGYEGPYWSRLRLNRWATDVEPVPWAADGSP